MKNIQETITNLTRKYQNYLSIFITNMRLMLLIVFAVLSVYLIIRVNSLVSEDSSAHPASTPTVISKKPDRDVISVFNELQSQNIEVSSQFDTTRNNPF